MSRVAWLVVPALGFLAMFYLAPLAELLRTSLDGGGWSVRHYRDFFTTPAYLRVLAQTFRVSGEVMLLCLLLGYPTAYVLATRQQRIWRLALFFVVVPYLTSFLVRTYAWIVLLNDQGIVNGALKWLGLIEQPVKLLYNAVGVRIGMLHIMLPLMVLPLYGVMRGIDPQLVRAAASLGATPARAFWRVFIPLSLPGVRSGCFLVFTVSLGFYVTPALLGGLEDVMLSTFIQTQVHGMLNFQFAAAAAMILFAATLVLFVLFGRGLAGTGLTGPAVPGGPVPEGKVWHSRVDQKGGLALALWLSALRRVDHLLSALAARGWERRASSRRAPLELGPKGVVLVAGLVLGFLLLPSMVVMLMSFSGSEFLSFPPERWSLRWYRSYFTDRTWLWATWNSFRVALASTALATILGTLAALGMVRGRFRGRQLVMGFILSPLIVPSVVVGIAVFQPLVDWGLIATVPGLVVGHTLGGITYVVVIVAAALSAFDTRLERAAASLGAGPTRTFRKVTLPLIAPAVMAGALFAFMHSFDEIVVTIFIGGVLVQTLPLRMWETVRHEIDPTIAAVSSLLILLPFFWLMLLEANRRLAERRLRGTR